MCSHLYWCIHRHHQMFVVTLLLGVLASIVPAAAEETGCENRPSYILDVSGMDVSIAVLQKKGNYKPMFTKRFTVTAACNGGAASTGNLKLDDHDPRVNHPGDTAALVFEGLSGMLNASEHSHIANRLPWTAELQEGGFKFRGCEATFDVILQGVFHEIATEFRLGSKAAKALIDPSKEKCPGALVVPGTSLLTSRIEPLFVCLLSLSAPIQTGKGFQRSR